MDYKKLSKIKYELENELSNQDKRVNELKKNIKNHPGKIKLDNDLLTQKVSIEKKIDAITEKGIDLKNHKIDLISNLKIKNITNDILLKFLSQENTIQRNPIKKFFGIPKDHEKLSRKDIKELVKKIDEIYTPLIKNNEIKKEILQDQNIYINQNIKIKEQLLKSSNLKKDIELNNNRLGTKQKEIKSLLDSVIDLNFKKAKEKIIDSKIGFKDFLSFIKELINGKNTNIEITPGYKEKLKDLEKNIEFSKEIIIDIESMVEKAPIIENEYERSLNVIKDAEKGLNIPTELIEEANNIIKDYEKNENNQKIDLNNNSIEDRFENDLNRNGISDIKEEYEHSLNVIKDAEKGLNIPTELIEKANNIIKDYESNNLILSSKSMEEIINFKADKLDIEKLPLKDFEKLGFSENDVYNKLKPENISELLKMGKTEIISITIKKEGIEFKVDAKLSLLKDKDGNMNLRVHPYRKEIENTYNLSKDDLSALKEGKIIEKTVLENGIKEKMFFQLDKQINEIVKHKKSDLEKNLTAKIPFSKEQKELIYKGKTVTIKGPNGSKSFNVKLNLDKKKGYSIDKKPLKLEKSKTLKTGR
ncbi:DUF4099 domain-containing protein [Tenacibaculum finnmarkense]|uniref:DUF4099 domain-containing protein n=1 Tax=Tenacibaculum finnmarkense TaxID=2781243 RepID=UPI001EFBCDBF|nr:DUF4099 domain-containing protein [Tenacibaculum finnmarkense]MCG8226371.1 DUF4099 domain-containing protein [Tenacibaculum finnmarkense genomovar finnmarkense]